MEELGNQVIGNISTISNNINIGIQSKNSPFCQAFYFQDYYDDKSVKNFVNSTKKIIRSSVEYKTYIELLRTNVLELNKDIIQSNITNADAPLEFHHYPLTIHEIIETVMLYHIVNNEQFSSFSLAKEIMDLHYENIIGLVSLNETNHELAHTGNIFISKGQVFGDYKKFLDRYEKGLSVDVKSNIEVFEKYSDDDIPVDFKRIFD